MPASADIVLKDTSFFCPDKLKGSLRFSDKAKVSLSATDSAVTVIIVQAMQKTCFSFIRTGRIHVMSYSDPFI